MGTDLAGYRYYLPGDPLRIIHWRNTARVGRPMVKEFDSSRGQTLHLLFDATQGLGSGQKDYSGVCYKNHSQRGRLRPSDTGPGTGVGRWLAW